MDFDGKLIWVYFSSLQEQKPFCHDTEISASIDRKMKRCDARGCSLVILPFTIEVNREGLLNQGCIEKPIERLRAQGIEVRIVYLRRADVAQIEEIDKLIGRYSNRTITSRQRYAEQAGELLRIVREVDP